jgi:hypothetical protein
MTTVEKTVQHSWKPMEEYSIGANDIIPSYQTDRQLIIFRRHL